MSSPSNLIPETSYGRLLFFAGGECMAIGGGEVGFDGDGRKCGSKGEQDSIVPYSLFLKNTTAL
ncbi:hypothetical protein BOTCAL_0117g00060 [Botryotinia calthae]|uniref:Uncharacterized protein n=1 Tax=Botryotinia calthae TaxID=38488 RepID=A0A4Y8D4U8_9HELO|nr:hypothetical protein BOTCAL_0117g00060 [Botryotinia calthae]